MIMLRRRLAAVMRMACRVRMVVAVIMVKVAGGRSVVMAADGLLVDVLMCSVLKCLVNNSCRAIMTVDFQRHDDLGGERSNGQQND